MDIVAFYDKSSDTFVSQCIHFLEYRSHIQFRCNDDKTQTIASFLNRSVSQRRKLDPLLLFCALYTTHDSRKLVSHWLMTRETFSQWITEKIGTRVQSCKQIEEREETQRGQRIRLSWHLSRSFANSARVANAGGDGKGEKDSERRKALRKDEGN